MKRTLLLLATLAAASTFATACAVESTTQHSGPDHATGDHDPGRGTSVEPDIAIRGHVAVRNIRDTVARFLRQLSVAGDQRHVDVDVR